MSDTFERNVISGNGNVGIYISGAGTNNNVLAGNTIGLNFTGTSALANVSHGVLVSGGATNTVIGTNGSNDAFNANEKNVIAGNAGFAIGVYNAGTNNTVIAGNWIGLDTTGNVRIQNGSHGIAVGDGADDTRIGTDGNGIADVEERNVVSGSFYSNIVVEGQQTDRTVIAGNYIGPNASATAAIATDGSGSILRYGARIPGSGPTGRTTPSTRTSGTSSPVTPGRASLFTRRSTTVPSPPGRSRRPGRLSRATGSASMRPGPNSRMPGPAYTFTTAPPMFASGRMATASRTRMNGTSYPEIRIPAFTSRAGRRPT